MDLAVSSKELCILLAAHVERHERQYFSHSSTFAANPDTLRVVCGQLALLDQNDDDNGSPSVRLSYGEAHILRYLLSVFSRLPSLKIASVQADTAPGTLSLWSFTSMRALEVHGFPMTQLRDLDPCRFRLQSLSCHHGSVACPYDALRPHRPTPAAHPAHLVWPNLHSLSLRENGLDSLDESLELCTAIRTLDLSGNHLTRVTHLHNCISLRSLMCDLNRLVDLEHMGHGYLGNIQQLSLRANGIVCTNGIDRLYSLEDLDLGDNAIALWSEVERLQALPLLKKLNFQGNPISEDPTFPSRFRLLFPDLEIGHAQSASAPSHSLPGHASSANRPPPFGSPRAPGRMTSNAPSSQFATVQNTRRKARLGIGPSVSAPSLSSGDLPVTPSTPIASGSKGTPSHSARRRKPRRTPIIHDVDESKAKLDRSSNENAPTDGASSTGPGAQPIALSLSPASASTPLHSQRGSSVSPIRYAHRPARSRGRQPRTHLRSASHDIGRQSTRGHERARSVDHASLTISGRHDTPPDAGSIAVTVPEPETALGSSTGQSLSSDSPRGRTHALPISTVATASTHPQSQDDTRNGSYESLPSPSSLLPSKLDSSLPGSSSNPPADSPYGVPPSRMSGPDGHMAARERTATSDASALREQLNAMRDETGSSWLVVLNEMADKDDHMSGPPTDNVAMSDSPATAPLEDDQSRLRDTPVGQSESEATLGQLSTENDGIAQDSDVTDELRVLEESLCTEFIVDIVGPQFPSSVRPLTTLKAVPLNNPITHLPVNGGGHAYDTAAHSGEVSESSSAVNLAIPSTPHGGAMHSDDGEGWTGAGALPAIVSLGVDAPRVIEIDVTSGQPLRSLESALLRSASLLEDPKTGLAVVQAVFEPGATMASGGAMNDVGGNPHAPMALASESAATKDGLSQPTGAPVVRQYVCEDRRSRNELLETLQHIAQGNMIQRQFIAHEPSRRHHCVACGAELDVSGTGPDSTPTSVHPPPLQCPRCHSTFIIQSTAAVSHPDRVGGSNHGIESPSPEIQVVGAGAVTIPVVDRPPLDSFSMPPLSSTAANRTPNNGLSDAEAVSNVPQSTPSLVKAAQTITPGRARPPMAPTTLFDSRSTAADMALPQQSLSSLETSNVSHNSAVESVQGDLQKGMGGGKGDGSASSLSPPMPSSPRPSTPPALRTLRSSARGETDAQRAGASLFFKLYLEQNPKMAPTDLLPEDFVQSESGDPLDAKRPSEGLPFELPTAASPSCLLCTAVQHGDKGPHGRKSSSSAAVGPDSLCQCQSLNETPMALIHAGTTLYGVGIRSTSSGHVLGHPSDSTVHTLVHSHALSHIRDVSVSMSGQILRLEFDWGVDVYVSVLEPQETVFAFSRCLLACARACQPPVHFHATSGGKDRSRSSLPSTPSQSHPPGNRAPPAIPLLSPMRPPLPSTVLHPSLAGSGLNQTPATSVLSDPRDVTSQAVCESLGVSDQAAILYIVRHLTAGSISKPKTKSKDKDATVLECPSILVVTEDALRLVHVPPEWWSLKPDSISPATESPGLRFASSVVPDAFARGTPSEGANVRLSTSQPTTPTRLHVRRTPDSGALYSGGSRLTSASSRSSTGLPVLDINPAVRTSMFPLVVHQLSLADLSSLTVDEQRHRVHLGCDSPAQLVRVDASKGVMDGGMHSPGGRGRHAREGHDGGLTVSSRVLHVPADVSAAAPILTLEARSTQQLFDVSRCIGMAWEGLFRIPLPVTCLEG